MFPHASGRWARKIKGQLRYFGPWEDLTGALAKHAAEFDDWNNGCIPHLGPVTDVVVRNLVNEFLTKKTSEVESGDISPGTLAE